MPLPAPTLLLSPERTRKPLRLPLNVSGAGRVVKRREGASLGSPDAALSGAGAAELKMSAASREERSDPPGGFAKRVLVTGGAGFM